MAGDHPAWHTHPPSKALQQFQPRPIVTAHPSFKMPMRPGEMDFETQGLAACAFIFRVLQTLEITFKQPWKYLLHSLLCSYFVHIVCKIIKNSVNK
jgi:hypothetical protein